MSAEAGAGPAIELSTVVLCYRAEENILRVIEPLYEQLSASGIAYELVLVANYHSDAHDSTPAVIGRFAEDRSNVVTVRQPKKGAMGWDMRSGLAATRGQLLIVIDGDDQNPVEDVLRMYRHMRQYGADVAKGRRVARFDGYYRHMVSIVYNALFLLVFRTRGIWDINGKPKGMTREAYDRMNLTSDDWFIDAEIVLAAQRLGLTVEEVPVVFRRNATRASFVRLDAILEFLRNMLSYRLHSGPR